MENEFPALPVSGSEGRNRKSKENDEMELEAERLILREMTEEDLPGWGLILQDKEVMYAYEHAFSPEEVREWMVKQAGGYRQ